MSKVLGEVIATPGEEYPNAAVISSDGKEWTRLPVMSKVNGEAAIVEILAKLKAVAIEEAEKVRKA
jgi:hypothetical protein